MTMNPLPPQAYTKETLVMAYEWLNRQSKEIREMANTPDILVSLYNKARMQGDEALERPSIQNFKNELKSLAGMMGEFEVVEPEYAPRPSHRAAGTPLQTSPAAYSSSAASTGTAPTPAPAAAPAANFKRPLNPINTATNPTLTIGFDAKTQAMLAELKEQFNLSSENEALRLAVSTGAKKLLGLLN